MEAQTSEPLVLLKIAQFLPRQDLLRCRQTCAYWKECFTLAIGKELAIVKLPLRRDHEPTCLYADTLTCELTEADFYEQLKKKFHFKTINITSGCASSGNKCSVLEAVSLLNCSGLCIQSTAVLPESQISSEEAPSLLRLQLSRYKQQAADAFISRLPCVAPSLTAISIMPHVDPHGAQQQVNGGDILNMPIQALLGPSPVPELALDLQPLTALAGLTELRAALPSANDSQRAGRSTTTSDPAAVLLHGLPQLRNLHVYNEVSC